MAFDYSSVDVSDAVEKGYRSASRIKRWLWYKSSPLQPDELSFHSATATLYDGKRASMRKLASGI